MLGIPKYRLVDALPLLLGVCTLSGLIPLLVMLSSSEIAFHRTSEIMILMEGWFSITFLLWLALGIVANVLAVFRPISWMMTVSDLRLREELKLSELTAAEYIVPRFKPLMIRAFTPAMIWGGLWFTGITFAFLTILTREVNHLEFMVLIGLFNLYLFTGTLFALAFALHVWCALSNFSGMLRYRLTHSEASSRIYFRAVAQMFWVPLVVIIPPILFLIVLATSGPGNSGEGFLCFITMMQGIYATVLFAVLRTQIVSTWGRLLENFHRTEPPTNELEYNR